MKILSTYSIINSRKTTFHAKDIKPIFKSEIPEEIISNAAESIETHHDLFGWVGGLLAGAAAIWALVKGHKTKADLKNKSKILTEEKNSVDKSIEKLRQSIEELKNKNINLDKELEDLKHQEMQPNILALPHTQKPKSPIETSGHSQNIQRENFSNLGASSNYRTPNVNSEVVVHQETRSIEKPDSSPDLFEEKVRDFQENYVRKVQGLEKEMESLQDIKGKIDIAEMLTKINEIKGFERIQGYSNVKDFLNEKYIKPLKNNDEKLIPNIILMYGPQGTGKTLFANELSYEAKCNKIKLDLERDESKNIVELKKKLNEAVKIFETTGKKSLIQIDELDILAFKDTKLQKEFLNIVNNLSEKYHSTIISTTNYPQFLDKSILDAQKIEMVYVAPPNKQDIAQILKFVCQYISESNINYQELAEQIIQKAGNDFYSSARIYKFISNVVEQHQNFTTKLTQKELLEYIKKYLANADISGSNIVAEYKNFTNNQVRGTAESDAFTQKVTEATNELKQRMGKLQQDLEQVQAIRDKSNISELLVKLNNIRGFERIRGYNNIKEFFNIKLINPIKTQNNKEIPNAVLMYGPQGTGKTLFAKELAYEMNAEYVEMEISRNELKNLQALTDIANNAKQTYEKTGKRTLIQIDELDALTLENKTIKDKFIKLIDNLSNGYCSTIIATTNNPQNLDKNILQISKFEKLYVPPANKQDIAEILQFVGAYIGEANVDYNKLADLVMLKAGKDAYSSARIYKFITSVVSRQKNLSNKLSQKDYETIITQELLPPDITRKELGSYQHIF